MDGGIHLNISHEYVNIAVFGGTMNKKIKDMIVIIGLVIGTLGFIITIIDSKRIEPAPLGLNFLLYSLCLIIFGISRET